MREILFRGKRADNGMWVFGNYRNCWRTGNKRAVITTIPDSPEKIPFSYLVVPSTVGQYVCSDMVDNKIFEGDIVRDHNGQTYVMVFYEKYNCYLFVREYTPYAGIKPKEVEVVGNIFDNPELLEVSK